MAQVNDLSRSLVSFEQNGTLVVVLEMSQSSWLAAGVVPGVERRLLKKVAPDPAALLHLVGRWRDQAVKAGQTVSRAVLAFEAGRDGFWLARWLRARGIETYVVHSTSVAVSREHRRAKTDRLDTEMLTASSWDGYVGSPGIARWWQSRPLRRRTPSARAVSEKAWLVNVPASSTA